MGVIRQQRSRFLDYLLAGHAASHSLVLASHWNCSKCDRPPSAP